jgi:L-ascorbate metabolism protein UlaG (beta-lactamase superfamily)
MRVTKFGHACVRIEHDGVVVVIDPGGFTEAEAVDGADAVLITHEHGDHYFPDHLLATDARVFTIESVATKVRDEAPAVADRLTVVAPGDIFDAGLPVKAVGELHAVIYADLPRVTNSGYLLSVGDTSIYHPGDALTPPGEGVDLLCLPVSAPWLKVSEAIDFARTVKAQRNLAIHDRIYSTVGLGIVDQHLGRFLSKDGLDYSRISEGTDL